jgi:hypothetical protein
MGKRINIIRLQWKAKHSLPEVRAALVPKQAVPVSDL